MRVSEFFRALKDHINDNSYTTLAVYLKSNKIDVSGYVQFVSSSFDLELETRTRMLALYLLLKKPDARHQYHQDFVSLFDMAQFDADIEREGLGNNNDSMNIDLPKPFTKRTFDTKIFEQPFSFLSEFSSQIQELKKLNVALIFESLMKDLKDRSQSLVDLEIRLNTSDKKANALFKEELKDYCQKLEFIIKICQDSEGSEFCRSKILDFFKRDISKIVAEFEEFFDDGVHRDESLKQKFLRTVINLFYRDDLLDLNISKADSCDETEFFTDENLQHSSKLHFEFLSQYEQDGLTGESSNLSCNKEIAEKLLKFAIVTRESAPLLDYRILTLPFTCSETAWKFTDDQDQLLVLARNAFTRGYVGMFRACYAKLRDKSKRDLISTISEFLKNRYRLEEVQLSMILYIIPTAQRLFNADIPSAKKFFNYVPRFLNFESEISALVSLAIFKKLRATLKDSIKQQLQLIYNQLHEFLYNSVTVEHVEDYESQMKRLLTNLLKHDSGIIKLEIVDLVRFTSLKISDYFEPQDYSNENEEYLLYIISLIVKKAAEAEYDRLQRELVTAEDNLRFILNGVHFSKIIQLLTEVRSQIRDRHERYCADILFIVKINDHLNQIEQEGLSQSEAFKAFIEELYRSLISKHGLFSILTSISMLPISGLIDFSEMPFEQAVEEIMRKAPNSNLNFCLRASTLISHKSFKFPQEKDALILNCQFICDNFVKINAKDRAAWLLNFNIGCLESTPDILIRLLNSFFIHGNPNDTKVFNMPQLFVNIALLAKSSGSRNQILNDLRPSQGSEFFRFLCDEAKLSLQHNPKIFKLSSADRQYVRDFISYLTPEQEVDENLPHPSARRSLDFSGL